MRTFSKSLTNQPTFQQVDLDELRQIEGGMVPLILGAMAVSAAAGFVTGYSHGQANGYTILEGIKAPKM